MCVSASSSIYLHVSLSSRHCSLSPVFWLVAHSNVLTSSSVPLFTSHLYFLSIVANEHQVETKNDVHLTRLKSNKLFQINRLVRIYSNYLRVSVCVCVCMLGLNHIIYALELTEHLNIHGKRFFFSFPLQTSTSTLCHTDCITHIHKMPHTRNNLE